MSWGTKRRNTILLIIGIIILVPIIVLSFVVFYEPSNCFDQIQNGDEFGIDCGGSCSLLCNNQTVEPIVVWKRFFEVAPGYYNVMAYIENPNTNAGIKKVNYIFELFNQDNVLIADTGGSVELKPRMNIPIIGGTLFTDKQIPARVAFRFTDDLVWQKTDPQDPIILVKDEFISGEDFEPKIEADLKNLSLKSVEDIRVVAIVYDNSDNAIGSSSTVVPIIKKDETVPIVFTWPGPFGAKVGRFELIPLYDSPE